MKDEQNRIIAGLFNEFELVKINLPRYRVVVKDTKIKNKKKWIKLHYKGYSDEFDEWRVDDDDGEDIVDLEDERKS